MPEGKVVVFTTIGLLQLGQKELVLCLRQHSDDHLSAALQLFQGITEQAREGHLVDVNGLTELGPNGIFGNSKFTGIGYARSHSLS